RGRYRHWRGRYTLPYPSLLVLLRWLFPMRSSVQVTLPSGIVASTAIFNPSRGTCMSSSFWGRLLPRSLARFTPPGRKTRRPAEQRQLFLELLEVRDVPSGLQPNHVLLPHDGGGATPFGSPGPTGTTPAKIRHAYGIDQITFS